MKELKSWYEDDGFWKKVSPILFGEKCWKSTAPQIDQVTHLLGLKPPLEILDLCCGLGPAQPRTGPARVCGDRG